MNRLTVVARRRRIGAHRMNSSPRPSAAVPTMAKIAEGRIGHPRVTFATKAMYAPNVR
jgi:hypothetical protein